MSLEPFMVYKGTRRTDLCPVHGGGAVEGADELAIPPEAGLPTLIRRGEPISVVPRTDEPGSSVRKWIASQQGERVGIALEQAAEQMEEPIALRGRRHRF